MLWNKYVNALVKNKSNAHVKIICSDESLFCTLYHQRIKNRAKCGQEYVSFYALASNKMSLFWVKI